MRQWAPLVYRQTIAEAPVLSIRPGFEPDAHRAKAARSQLQDASLQGNGNRVRPITGIELGRILWICAFTVLSETDSPTAICLFDCPAATRLSTSFLAP